MPLFVRRFQPSVGGAEFRNHPQFYLQIPVSTLYLLEYKNIDYPIIMPVVNKDGLSNQHCGFKDLAWRHKGIEPSTPQEKDKQPYKTQLDFMKCPILERIVENSITFATLEI